MGNYEATINKHFDTPKQNSRADNRILICVLSALRLCVWLFDNCGIQLFYID